MGNSTQLTNALGGTTGTLTGLTSPFYPNPMMPSPSAYDVRKDAFAFCIQIGKWTDMDAAITGAKRLERYLLTGE